MKATVTVIIPSYNRAHTLARALNSVLQQTHRADEIIVIDDGSEDHTATLMQQHFPTVQYHRQAQQGVSAARNTGIQLASNEWIALLDSDDAWQPNKLQQQLAAIQQSDCLLCHTDETWIRNGKQIKPLKKHAKKGGWIFQQCLPLCVIAPSATLIHRSLFDAVGLFDTRLPACEDYDLWLRITARFPVLYVDEKLTTRYGGHADQLSQQYWGMDRFRIQALDKLLKHTELTAEDKKAAIAIVCEKIEIYLKGAIKRDKTAEIQHYQALREKWS